MLLQGWSEELAQLAERVASTCNGDQTPTATATAALNSQYSWIVENRYLVANATMTDNTALDSAFRCWYNGEDCSAIRREEVPSFLHNVDHSQQLLFMCV